MKRTILGLVTGLLLGTVAMVSGQSGPFSSQIQSALRSFSISPTFTGPVTVIGTLSSDSPTFVVDAVNHRVGIGTSTPAFVASIGTSGDTFGLAIGSVSSSTGSRLKIGYLAATDAGVIQAINEGIAFKSLGLNPSGGNVGIGATAPAYLLSVGGVNGQQSGQNEATTTVTCNSGGATCVATSLIPAGSIVLGVDIRVTTILAGAGLTTWKAGDGTTTNAFANTAALAAGTTTDLTTHVSTWKPTLYIAATSVTLTANAGVFSSGVVRITVHYFSITAATS
jgi:hypothetical protein